MKAVLRGFFWTFLLFAGLIAGLSIWLIWFFPGEMAARFAERSAKSYEIALSIGSLSVRPLHGLTAENLTLDVPANRDLPPLVTIERVEVEWEPWAIIDRKVHVTGVLIERPTIHALRRNGKWNLDRAFADAAEEPVQNALAAIPTPPPGTLEEQLQSQSEWLESALLEFPVDLAIDAIRVRGAGAKVETERGTVATVAEASFTLAASIPRGRPGQPGSGKSPGPTISLDLHPQPAIEIDIQPSGGIGFSGRLQPSTHLEVELPRRIEFATHTLLREGTIAAGGFRIPLDARVRGDGRIDLPGGNVTLRVEEIAAGNFFDASGSMAIHRLGVDGFNGAWNADLRAAGIPAAVTTDLARAARSFGADSLSPGGILTGRIGGTLESTDPSVLREALAGGRFPMTLAITSEGKTGANPVTVQGMRIGGIDHRARLEIAPHALTVESELRLSGLRRPGVLGGERFSLHAAERIQVPASLDRLELVNATVEIPEQTLAFSGRGNLGGLKAAAAAFQQAEKHRKAGEDGWLGPSLAAITALSSIDLTGSVRIRPERELEVTEGVFIRGSLEAEGRLTRAADPFGRIQGEMRFREFFARIADAPASTSRTAVASATDAHGSPAAIATPGPDLLTIEGMTAHLTLDRELVLGGSAPPSSADLGRDEAVIFDPATRGYYDRLGSLRAETDNLQIDRVMAGPLRISDLSAEVLYDGTAVKVNRARMQLLGGEAVGRMIVRPTSKGLHVTMASDMSGIDLSPMLLDVPVGRADDARVHMSTTARFFLAEDDPIGSLADARARVDVTAAGSKVLETLLAWLDPENQDPMYNWARGVNRKVVGLSRPRFSAVADRGMYDVTIGFPSLRVSKDVRRIPLAPLLRLRFTREMLAPFTPPGAALPLLAARGIDADGNLLLPPTPLEEN